jgi:hypothetical protein
MKLFGFLKALLIYSYRANVFSIITPLPLQTNTEFGKFDITMPLAH